MDMGNVHNILSANSAYKNMPMHRHKVEGLYVKM